MSVTLAESCARVPVHQQINPACPRCHPSAWVCRAAGGIISCGGSCTAGKGPPSPIASSSSPVAGRLPGWGGLGSADSAAGWSLIMQRYRRDPIWLIVVLGAFQISMLQGAAVTHRARREEGTLPAACFAADRGPPPRPVSADEWILFIAAAVRCLPPPRSRGERACLTETFRNRC